MLSYLLYFLVASSQHYATLLFFQALFKKLSLKPFEKRTSYLGFLLLSVVLFAITYLIKFAGILPFSYIIINQILLFLYYVGYVYIKFSKIWYVPILAYLVNWITVIVMEYLLIALFTRIFKPEQFMTLFVQGLGAGFFTFGILISAVIADNIRIRVVEKVKVPAGLRIYLVVSPVVLLIIYNSVIVNSLEQSSIALILCLLILLFGILIFNWFSEQHKTLTIEHLKTEKDTLSHYATSMDNMYQDIRHYKHDIENTLLSLKASIDKGDIEKVKEIYYDEIMSASPHTDMTYHILSMLNQVKEPTLKGILLSKMEQAYALGVNIKFGTVECIEVIGDSPVNICRVIGIAMDNSIEAALESEEKLMIVEVLNIDEAVTIGIRNSYKDAPDFTKITDLGYSTKGENRGVGLHSLQAVIEKDKNLNVSFNLEKQFVKSEIQIQLA